MNKCVRCKKENVALDERGYCDRCVVEIAAYYLLDRMNINESN